MYRFLTLLLLVVMAPSVTGQGSAPAPEELASLVAKLGSTDFQEREAATKRLEDLGTTAIEALRSGARSDDPETARRAQELLRKAERRVVDQKLLAPTLVELAVKDLPVDSVLADLSKQAGCEVVLGGVKPEDAATRKISVSTGGKVSFWTAVLKVCDAGGLKIAAVGGFPAPGAMPYLGRAKPGVRIAVDRNRAVVLESRDDAAPRPVSMNGAVLVEALPLPRGAGHGTSTGTLLQVWPEPRFRWEGTTAAKFARAVDTTGNAMQAVFTIGSPAKSAGPSGEGMVLIRNPDGTASLVRSPTTATTEDFRPNPRQAMIRFKAMESNPPTAKDLEVSLFATVRTSVVPLCSITGLEVNRIATATGYGGSEISMSYAVDGKGKIIATIQVAYEANVVQTATVSDDLPGVRAAAIGSGNQTIYGVRVSDADGKPYTLGLISGSNQFDSLGKRVLLKLQLELHADRGGQGVPHTATLWGTYSRSVEVPLHFRDVPIMIGK